MVLACMGYRPHCRQTQASETKNRVPAEFRPGARLGCMIARRMLTFVAVLLALTALAAAFAPPPSHYLSNSPSPEPTAPPSADGPQFVDTHLDIDRRQKTTITLQ